MEQRVDVTAGTATMRVSASGAGAVRIEVFAPADGAPERASWAVLPEHWHTELALASRGPHAFEAGGLAVTLDPGTLGVTVATADGSTVLAAHGRDPVRVDEGGVRLRFEAPAGTLFYGLGDKPCGLEKRGHAFTMWNTDAYGFGESTDPLYKSIPFLLGRGADGSWWGLLVDCTFRLGFDLASTEPDVLAIATAAPSLRCHVLAGPGPADVLARYAALVGTAPMPPLWSLGYGQCRYSYESADRALDVVRSHREAGIGLDAVWLDIGFQDRNRPYTTDPALFPALGELVAAVAAEGVRTVVIADLHVPVLPGAGYHPYDSGDAGDHFVRREDGERYVGAVWPGPCHFPDFTRAATRAWWGTLAARFVADGVAGFWNDMNEPAVFKAPGHTMTPDVRHRIDEPGFAPRTATHAEIHNVYGMQNARATHDGLLELRPDRRPFVLTRASYAGGHRHAATWTGDNTSSWNHLKLSAPQLLSLGLGGFGLAGCDIGGFRGSPSPDLLTQWIATGVFNPLFRNHTDAGTRDQEATVHGVEHETLRRRAIATRYRLLPYLYTLVEEMTRTGLPPMRPLFLEFPDLLLARIDTSWMLGSALLIAPPPDETLDPYEVVLPENTTWFDFWSGLPAAPEPPASPNTSALPDPVATFRCARRLGHVPVFVRAGSVLPLGRALPSTARRTGSLRLHVFPDASGQARGTVYDDDGESFGFRRGAFFRQSFLLDDGVFRLDRPDGSRAPYWHRTRVVLHDASPDWQVLDEDGQAVRTRFDPAARTLRFRAGTGAGRFRVGLR